MITVQIHKAGTLTGHQNPIFAVENGPEASMLFTAGNDKGVVQWNMDTFAFERILYPVQSSVYALHLLSDTTFMVIGTRSGKVMVVDTLTQKLVASLEHHKRPVFDIKSFRNKPELILSSEDGTVSVWDTANFRLLYHFKVAEQTVRTIAISQGEETLVFGTKAGNLKIYNASDYGLMTEILAHTMPVTSLAFSPDGRFLLTGGRDAKLNVLHATDFSVVNSFVPHMFTVYAIKYHPVLPIFATASRDKSIKIWTADDFRLLRIVSFEKGLDGHLLSINDIAWNAHKNQLVSVSDDKKAMVWDVAVTN